MGSRMVAGCGGTRRTGAGRDGARRGARAGLRAAGRFFVLRTVERAGFFRRVADFFDRRAIFVARDFALARAGRAGLRFFAIHPSRLMEQSRILTRKLDKLALACERFGDGAAMPCAARR
jgi:hypothetical protein